MNPRDEDDAWRAIVENFGERAVLDEEPPSAELDPDDLDSDLTEQGTPVQDPRQGSTQQDDTHGPFMPDPEAYVHADPPQQSTPTHDDPGRFVPPTPPLPYVPPKRLLAWGTLAFVPVILIVATLTSRPFSGTVATLFVACWVGAFGYLVWTMPTDPPDPFDDGSRV